MVEPPDGKASRSVRRVSHLGAEQAQRRPRHRDPRGSGALDQLLAAADVLVHNFGPTCAARARARRRLARRATHPDLIGCSVLSWPANHVDADRPVDELLAMARLGVLDEQQGYRAGPVFLRFPIGNWSSAYLLAIGIVTRLLVRERAGSSGPVHTSLAQGGLVPMAMHWQRGDAVAVARGRDAEEQHDGWPGALVGTTPGRVGVMWPGTRGRSLPAFPPPPGRSGDPGSPGAPGRCPGVGRMPSRPTAGGVAGGACPAAGAPGALEMVGVDAPDGSAPGVPGVP